MPDQTPDSLDAADAPDGYAGLDGQVNLTGPLNLDAGSGFQPIGDPVADHITQAWRYSTGQDDPSRITDPHMQATVDLFNSAKPPPLGPGVLGSWNDQTAANNYGPYWQYAALDEGANQAGSPVGAASNGGDNFGVTTVDPLTVYGTDTRGRGLAGTAADIAGKIWGLPNTLLGLALAGGAYAAGEIAGTHPQFHLGNNAIQMTGNPLTLEKGGTITVGNVQIYGNGSTPEMTGRSYAPDVGDVSMGRHEEGHTYQSQALGPLYLPLWLAYGGETPKSPLERSADAYGANKGGPFSRMTPLPLPMLWNFSQ